jgi:ABC-type transport system involved in multi-copper enzyme maturation permease subunit
MFGPLFYYELVRLARNGRTTVLRCAYALAVFAALGVVYLIHFPGHSLLVTPLTAPTESANQLARLAEDFVFAVLFAQSLAVVLVGPAYVAGAIAEERVRGTLDLLFTTHLTDREIVLGKLAARAVQLGSIIMAGLPLLAMTQVWGGVDARFLLAAAVATVLNVVCVVAFCIRHSAELRTVKDAVAWSYFSTFKLIVYGNVFALTPATLFLVLLKAASGPYSVRIPWMPTSLEIFHPLVAILSCVAGNCLWTAFSVTMARRRLRPRADPTKDVVPVPPPVPAYLLPPVGERPLLWKETYPGGGLTTRRFESQLQGNWGAVLFLMPLVLLPALTIRWMVDFDLPVARNLGLFLVLMVAAAWSSVTAVRAAGRVCREREAGTLDTLLTLPVSLWQLLAAKWSGAVLFGRGFGYVLAVVVGVELVTGTLHPTGVVMLALALAVHLAFFAGLGVWLSLVCRTAVAARTTVAAVLLAFVVAAFQCTLATSTDRTKRAAPLPEWVHVADVTNPAGAWWFFTSFPDDAAARGGRSIPSLKAAAGGVLVFVALAGGLWLDSLRRFRRYRVD